MGSGATHILHAKARIWRHPGPQLAGQKTRYIWPRWKPAVRKPWKPFFLFSSSVILTIDLKETVRYYATCKESGQSAFLVRSILVCFESDFTRVALGCKAILSCECIFSVLQFK